MPIVRVERTDAFKNNGRKFKQALKDEEHAFAQFVGRETRDEMRKHINAKAQAPSGRTARSIGFKVRGSGHTLRIDIGSSLPEDMVASINDGRGKEKKMPPGIGYGHSVPNVGGIKGGVSGDLLFNWSKRRFGLDDEEAEDANFAIRKAIQNKGTVGIGFVERGAVGARRAIRNRRRTFETNVVKRMR